MTSYYARALNRAIAQRQEKRPHWSVLVQELGASIAVQKAAIFASMEDDLGREDAELMWGVCFPGDELPCKSRSETKT